nr:PblA [Lachnospiraceae bacterium]
MAIELAKAYVQIVPSTEGMKGNLTKLMEPEAEEAGKKSGGKLASGIGSALKAGTAVIGAGLTAAVGAVGALSKSALDAFADYEQLTGGVETLFKDSSDIVMKYAEDAYKTSGLSANEYMETVTSFSASLLQSLGGDTEAAAEYAQTAIVDMSDNANKMGTSMESIQNAYQGFAKQNYTMLDNLKLGYGGTKSEMERLLADATELSGVEYDVNSYADIVSAIHVVQENLGITGTTALEASTTISGSVASMKSAWANFLTSMNRTPEQMKTSTDALVDSVVTAANNIIPKLATIIPNIVSGLGNIIQALMPQIPAIISTLLPALIEGASLLVQQLVTVLPEILASLSAVIPDVINAIMTMLPMLLDAAMQIVMALGQGLVESIPLLIPAAIDTILGLIDGFLDNLDQIINVGIDLMLSLALGLIDAIPKLVEKIPEIIVKLVEALTNPDTIEKLVGASFQIITSL